ncbi:MAG: AmpG family muropeptide MFS transporter [Acidimicrobiia bacterium]|nr:AmpG family muropeptide MFS transporter [Acidimicrobiia bacterium]
MPSNWPGTLSNLRRALASPRTAAVAVLSFSSGLPLGLVWIAIPDWMRDIGVDIRIVGLLSLAQAPWAFKVIWSPLMDRYVPPFWGRRRGWMAIAQVALLGLGLLLAGVGDRPETVWVVGAIALATGLAAASQDIAYDAYAVDVLRKDEQGIAVGARTAFYRAAMLLAGGIAISLAARVGWMFVNVFLALCYVPMLLVTWKAPEPEVTQLAPRTLRDAVWLPFVQMLARPRALEILAFVVLYKFSDQLTQTLTRPFLNDIGYSADQRGFALATLGVVATVGGAVAGGWLTTLAGLGHALWIFGLLQLFSNAGYWLIAYVGVPNLPLMYGATSFEYLTSGMGTGAFGVLLLRLTEKRFSATQYALFSSLFAAPRVLAGPIAGVAVDSVGWATFYLATMIVGIPGLIMLARFVPPGVREPTFEAPQLQGGEVGDHVDTAGLLGRGVAATVVTGIAASLVLALMAAIDAMRRAKTASLSFGPAWTSIWQPQGIDGWLQILSIAVFSLACGMGAVAMAAAKRRR